MPPIVPMGLCRAIETTWLNTVMVDHLNVFPSVETLHHVAMILPVGAKLIGIFSFLLWVGVIAASRWIAFV